MTVVLEWVVSFALGLLSLVAAAAIAALILMLAGRILFRQWLPWGRAFRVQAVALGIGVLGQVVLGGVHPILAMVLVLALLAWYYQRMLRIPMTYGTSALLTMLQQALYVLLWLALMAGVRAVAPEVAKQMEEALAQPGMETIGKPTATRTEAHKAPDVKTSPEQAAKQR